MSFFARSQEPQQEIPARLILDMMEKICAVANKHAHCFQIEPGSGYEDLLRAERNGRFHGFAAPDYARNGYLSFSQAATLGLLIDEIFDKRDKRILSLEPTQWGKTNLLMSVALILPVVHYLKTGQESIFAISVPGFNSLLAQSQARMKKVWKTISPINVRVGKKNMVVHKYWDMAGSNPADPDSNIITSRTRGKKGEDQLLTLINNLPSNVFAYYGEDECQHGQAVNGIAHRINSKIGRRNSTGYVLFSASPDEALAHEPVYHRVPGYVEHGYVGMDVVYGNQMRPLPATHHVPAYKRQLPNVCSIEDKFGELNTEDDYVHAIFSLLKNKSGGVFLRAPDRLNSRLDGIAKILEGEKIGIIRFYNKLEAPTMEQFREIVRDRQFVVLANNMGRMGDTPPYDCADYIDPTGEYSTTNALQQGTVGRASRYGCVCNVYLSQRNADWVNGFYDSDGSAAELVHPSALGNKIKHPSSRSRSELYYSDTGEKADDMEARYCYLQADQHKNEPFIVDLFKRANAALMLNGIQTIGEGAQTRKAAFHKDMASIFSDKAMKKLHEILGLGRREIVLYGEDEGNGKILLPKYELRQARDRADYGSISRNGGGHDRSGDCDNLAIWRFTKKVCPVCGQDPNPPTRKGMKRGEITEKLAERRTVRQCCRENVRAEIWLVHLRLRRTLTPEGRATLNEGCDMAIATTTRSRHHDLEPK